MTSEKKTFEINHDVIAKLYYAQKKKRQPIKFFDDFIESCAQQCLTATEETRPSVIVYPVDLAYANYEKNCAEKGMKAAGVDDFTAFMSQHINVAMNTPVNVFYSHTRSYFVGPKSIYGLLDKK